ncbi:MAG: ATP-binding cassette domain-containing protein [[Eubacterium] siraeum]
MNKNTTTFILGENGCGKTTLLKILTGEYQADSGSINSATIYNLDIMIRHRRILTRQRR